MSSCRPAGQFGETLKPPTRFISALWPCHFPTYDVSTRTARVLNNLAIFYPDFGKGQNEEGQVRLDDT